MKKNFLLCVLSLIMGCTNSSRINLISDKITNHWKGDYNSYFIKHNMLVVHPSNDGNGFLYTKKNFSNFILQFEFKLDSGSNNGIGIRSPITGDPAYDGLEIQILDNSSPTYANLYPWQYHGSIYGLAAAKRGHLKSVGEWNYQEIKIDNNLIKVTLNNHVILEADLNQIKKDALLDKKEHPGLHRTHGKLVLCGHGSSLMFKNMYIKEITSR